MIKLNEDLYVGSGKLRSCYRHPEHPDRCIKVCLPNRPFDPSCREAQFLTRLRRRRPGRFEYLPRFFGTVPTDQGVGHVFDLGRNETDGRVARTLGQMVEAELDHRTAVQLANAVTKLRDQLIRDWVPVRDIKPANLCAVEKSDRTFHLMVVDGIGHSDFIPLVNYVPFLARRKLIRHLDRGGFADQGEMENWVLRQTG